jgi:hypothetical protein
MKEAERILRACLVALLLLIAGNTPVWLLSAQAAGIDDTGSPFTRFPPGPIRPKSVQLPSAPTLEDEIVRTPMVVQGLNPIWLKGVPISGLHPKSVEILGSTYFIVVDNTKSLRMCDIYRWNRLNGKSNFVTTDSVIHPYFAFTNRLLAELVTHELVPELRRLLMAMQAVAVDDYKNADDVDVRRDVARNIAYLGTAIRFLDAHYEAPNLSSVPEMIDQEVHNIVAGTTATSPVFDGVQDYSVLVPVGWYNSSKELKNFYRCKEWLSLVPFAITDTSEGRANNTFRRSVLLFRSLYQANILGRPAMETWAKLVRDYKLLGGQLESYHQRTLYPDDYDLVLQQKSANLAVTLQSLAEPFFRTKLMLAVRNSKNNVLEAESVLQMNENESSSVAGVFRLFPMFGPAEMPWLRGISPYFPTQRDQAISWPASLLNMYVWGSTQAGNVLCDNMPSLDRRIAYVLPELQRCVVRRLPGGGVKPVDSRNWNILSPLFRPSPDNSPGVMRTDAWYTQRLISTSAGFVDSLCAIGPEISVEHSEQAAPAASASINRRQAPPIPGHSEAPAALAPSPVSAPDTSLASDLSLTAESSSAAATTAVPEGNTSESIGRVNPGQEPDIAPRRVHKVPPFHFLEPNVEVYKRLQFDAKRLKTDLEAIGYFPRQYGGLLDDFIRLFGRLEKIAEVETKGEAISVTDRRLLANIDQILDKVDVPLPSVLPVSAGQTVANTSVTAGFNMAVGRPGMLCIIYQNPHTMEWTLGRGAVYTYYEMPTPLLTSSSWQHKLDAGFAIPPSWCKRFEIVQPELPSRQATLPQ